MASLDPPRSTKQTKQTNAPLGNPTPYQLVSLYRVLPGYLGLTILQRSLVLDYLCHNCYTNTARAFARDSTVRHLDADGDEINNKPSDSVELSPAFLQHVDLRESLCLQRIFLPVHH